MRYRTLGVAIAALALLAAALPPPLEAEDLGAAPEISVAELDSVAAEVPGLNALQDTVATPAVSWTSEYSTAAALPSSTSLAAPEVAARRLCPRAEARVVVVGVLREGRRAGLAGIR